MEKIDLKMKLKDLYQASPEATVVEVPGMDYLMIDGEDPNTSKEYAEAVEALFSLAYALKFMFKKGETAVDYGHAAEGLWWRKTHAKLHNRGQVQLEVEHDDPAAGLRQPGDHFTAIKVRKKKKLAATRKLRFETFTEGWCAQILHIGPSRRKGRPSPGCTSLSKPAAGGQVNTTRFI
jgi:hypothetical protein